MKAAPDPNREEKLQEALRTVAAEFISREAGPQSLITVTRTSIANRGRRATIFITVLPESAEEAALAFLSRNRREFGEFFEERIRGASVPHVDFIIDLGEKNRQRLDELY